MPDQQPRQKNLDSGATAVINHHVRDDQHRSYEGWMSRISAIVSKHPGFLDSQVIRPVPGLTNTYTVIIRFDDRGHLEAWLNSDVRKNLIEEVRPLLGREDSYAIQSGLEFLFNPETPVAKGPVRWKQFLLTWSAIYPLVLIIPALLLPCLRLLGIPQLRMLDMLLVTGVMVALMVYLVMPRYTRLLRGWLFK